MIRILLNTASAFKIPLIIINKVVKSAFAGITIAEVAVAMTEFGVASAWQHAMLQELLGFVADATIADAPASDLFRFTRGGREGGGDTPLLWRILCDWILEPVISKWEVDRVGFVLREVNYSSTGMIVNHCVWADNLLLLARSADESRRMIADVSRRLYSTMGCRWKLDSLQIMPNAWARLDHGDLRRERFSVAVNVPAPEPRCLCWMGEDSPSAPSSASMQEQWWNRAERSTSEKKRSAEDAAGADVSRIILERAVGDDTPPSETEPSSSKRQPRSECEHNLVEFHFEVVSELLVLGIVLISVAVPAGPGRRRR